MKSLGGRWQLMGGSEITDGLAARQMKVKDGYHTAHFQNIVQPQDFPAFFPPPPPSDSKRLRHTITTGR